MTHKLEGVHDVNVANSDTARPAAEPSQDLQPLLLDAESVPELRRRVARLVDIVQGSAFTGLADLAVSLQRELSDRPVRCAVVAVSAEQAAERLTRLAARLGNDEPMPVIDVAGGVFAGQSDGHPAIGFLFPGQGSGKGTDGGALAGHFGTVRELYRNVRIPASDDPAATNAAQPRIVASSLAGLRVLSQLGIEALAVTGHSLGELTALYWAGAMTESALLDLAATRGQIMAESSAGGAMAGIFASVDEVVTLVDGEPIVVAGYNGPKQTVVAGPAAAIARIREAATASGYKATRLPVSDAFHSPAMEPAAAGLADYLAGTRLRPLERRVLSTVTGEALPSHTDLRHLLVRQLCEPVFFSQAVRRLAEEVDLLIEVGPGRVLSPLAMSNCPGMPVVPLVTDSTSLSGLLSVTSAAYVLGAPVRHDLLLAGLQLAL
jgi:acyl transferase domain-containing protein